MGSSLYGVGKECFVSLCATLRTLRLCGFASQTLVITSVLRPFNRRGTERTEDYGKIVGFLSRAHEPTENSEFLQADCSPQIAWTERTSAGIWRLFGSSFLAEFGRDLGPLTDIPGSCSALLLLIPDYVIIFSSIGIGIGI